MTLRIYMKSGNVIVLPHVKDYAIQNKGDDIIGLKIEFGMFWKFGERLLVRSINLSQIEAITRH